MKIEIIKKEDNPVAKFFSSPTSTPETDAVASPHIGFYSCSTVPAELCRRMERERDEARKDAEQLADKLSGLELRTTEELARLEQERDEAREKIKRQSERIRKLEGATNHAGGLRG